MLLYFRLLVMVSKLTCLNVYLIYLKMFYKNKIHDILHINIYIYTHIDMYLNIYIVYYIVLIYIYIIQYDI